MAGVLGLILSLIYTSFALFFNSPKVGISKKTDKSIFGTQQVQFDSDTYQTEIVPIQNNLPKDSFKSNNSPGTFMQSKIEYRAKQVLLRSDDKSFKKILPNGSNIIGKLLSAIDSRDLNSQVKVLLPYGASFKGEQFIEKNSMLIGKANYTGKGERIFITFDKSVSPSGDEKQIKASALDSSDYAFGIIGKAHSETGMRIAGTLGLTMVSSMTDVLTEKTVQSESGVVTPKSTMKNAIFQGVSDVSEMEAGRHAEAMAQTPPYVTLDSGIDLIISLSSAYGDDSE
jgi:hypothetical protein